MNQNALMNYRSQVKTIAEQSLIQMLGTVKGQAKAKRIELAFRAAAAANPNLLECSPDSVAEVLSYCLLADLEPGGHVPQVYIFNRRIKGTMRAQMSVAPAGVRELARRSGYILTEIPVFDGDAEEAMTRAAATARGEVYIPTPTPTARDLDDLIGFYVVITGGGERRVEWLGREDIEKRRECSDSWRKRDELNNWGKRKGSPWEKWPIEFAAKTALHWAIRRGYAPINSTAGRFLDAADAMDTPETKIAAPSQPEVSVPSASEVVAEAFGLEAPKETLDRGITELGASVVELEALRAANRDAWEAAGYRGKHIDAMSLDEANQAIEAVKERAAMIAEDSEDGGGGDFPDDADAP